MTIFGSNEIEKVENFFIDERVNPSDLLFVVYVLTDKLIKITLTESLPFTNFQKYEFSVVNENLYINGDSDNLYIDGDIKSSGFYKFEGLNFLVLSKEEAVTNFFTFNEDSDLVVSSDDFSGIKTPSTSRLILHSKSLLINLKDEWLYHNGEKVIGNQTVELTAGTNILTPYYLLEKRSKQYKLTIWSDEIKFDRRQVLLQDRKPEFPKDFPDYRRSPRLNLELPKDTFSLQGLDVEQNNKRDGLLKTILPPLGMIVMTGIMTYVSGQNLVMLLVMGGASLMTTAFTVTQYFEEKKTAKLETLKSKEDYEFYLVSEVGKISTAYSHEKEILAFKQPSPEQLVALTSDYNSRIYERQNYNKDFLTISLGLSDDPSNLKIETDVDAKSLSDNAKHLRKLKEQFETQRQVPTPISLLEQTLGLVGTQDVLTTTLENILFQTAFFHSYRDVNFISIFPRKAYQDIWSKWRLLPHYKLQDLNMRGLIYNEKLRDIVLNSFLQILNKRKQVVAESGREKVQFSPHYIFTIVDDELLAGHGINELLAEDMSSLGVTVIWCKEDVTQLPETVVSVVELPSATNGQLISDHGIYVAKDFMPYANLSELETSLRKLANLNHLEVEKNAIPESLSLLEQYEVKTIEELEISERWLKAEPNKSIKSLIGWRGKSDYAYWDLHERGHGPHALVGGTTGSGKSEFLTTYLIGLAINFSPEDVGMLIIDWKGGGIANTLDKLPHFMGAITNLDGAGTARALASIKAELDKRQREFAKFGVNNINDYMTLYKQRHNPKSDVKYPTKPLPHLILVSDEFAELKANVPEFLDELTSVARIGRSLGVHLILATQKPSGVVNDQIEANSKSKIALKMAGVEDSNELLKTPDAAHITNPGRGYLKVGENEVYELFQSGYAGVLYDPEATSEEKVDERLFRINDLGQYELMYDPTEEVVQGKDKSDLPTQLEAVIEEVGKIFDTEGYALPDKPWLPNLSEMIPTSINKATENRDLKIPLGLLDIPSKQAQEVYEFDLEKQGHTAIFGSPGYGKSTVLQTLVMNLARVNTPEQVYFNLLDFGTNGLLPLKALPHVADIVTFEETEKCQKMLASISGVLAERKKLFKAVGVATLVQYENKTKQKLPIIINILDSYDGIDPDDDFKDVLDSILMPLLRDGAGLGIYLIMTAGREGAVRMNMMSGITTKVALFLNDEADVEALMGREKVMQVPIIGRGQVMCDVPTAIQFHLPVSGENSTEVLNNLELEVETVDKAWTGERPKQIPMVPEKLSYEEFESYIKSENSIYLGLNKMTATATKIDFFTGEPIGIFSANKKQAIFLSDLLETQVSEVDGEVIVVDMVGNLSNLSSSIMVQKSVMNDQGLDIFESLQAATGKKDKNYLIILNGLEQIIEKMAISDSEMIELIEESGSHVQYILIDLIANVGNNYSALTKTVKDNVPHLLFSGDIDDQNFIEVTQELRKKKLKLSEMLYVKDEEVSTIVLPRKETQDE